MRPSRRRSVLVMARNGHATSAGSTTRRRRRVLLGALVALATTGSARAVASGMIATVARPRIISLSYGRFRPEGAPHAYLAFRFKILQRDGQIVETDYQELRDGKPSGVGGDGNSRCGIGGRKNGAVEVSYLPLSGPLTPGTHYVRVVAYGSNCTEHSPVRRASRIFKVRVSG